MTSLINGNTVLNGNINGVAHTEPEEIEIPVPWGHISGVWWGPRDVKPILCLHGWQDNAGTFDRLAPLLLPGGHSLLALDLMGHGRSSHYPKGQFYFLYWDGVMLVRRVCRHFGWDKVTLLGHSLGGAISFLYAASYPENIDKLICIDIVSPVIRPDEKIVKETNTVIDKFLEYETKPEKCIPSYMHEAMIDIVMDAYRGSITRESCDILLKRGITPSEDGKGYHFSRDPKLKVAGLGGLAKSLVLQYATKISCEVLNIKGKPGMVFDSEENYREIIEVMKKSAKKLEFHEVEGTHHLHLNTPERIVHIINNFLQDYDPNDLPV